MSAVQNKLFHQYGKTTITRFGIEYTGYFIVVGFYFLGGWPRNKRKFYRSWLFSGVL